MNAYQVRTFVLHRFFAAWRTRLDRSSDNQQRTLVLYEGNAIEKAFRRWFWRVSKKRIDEWGSARLKRLHFIQWALDLRKNLSRSIRVCNLRDGEIERRCVALWARKAKATHFKQQQAEAFHQRQLVARCLPRWERESRLAPAARQVQGIVQWRIAYSAFSTMELRLRIALQTKVVSRRRVMGNAWTQWNDRLRWQTAPSSQRPLCNVGTLSMGHRRTVCVNAKNA